MANHLWINVTLTSDLVYRIDIESGAYPLYSLSQEFKILCVDASMYGGVSLTFFGSL